MLLNEMEQRAAINYAKAIGIIYVVSGHLPNSIFNIITPYMFHMPLFFFLGGILFKLKDGKSFARVLVSKFIVYIIVTYTIIGLLSIVLNKYFGFVSIPSPFEGGVLHTLNNIFSSNFHNNNLFLVAWFLFAYMVSLVVLQLVCYAVRNVNPSKASAFLAVLGLASGWIGIDYLSVLYKSSGNILYHYACEFSVAFMFMALGKSISKSIFKLMNLNIAIVLFITIITLKYSGFTSDIVMSWSGYNHSAILTIIQVTGCIYLVMFMSSILSKTDYRRLSSFLGENTKSIMSYHFTVFIVIDWVLGQFFYLDYKSASALGGRFPQESYYAVYMVSALVVPVYCGMVWNRLISSIQGWQLLYKLREKIFT